MLFLTILFLLLSISSIHSDKGETWVILIAGANGYNYWSQGQICSAYHQIHDEAGVSNDHIIVWQYDDLVQNPQNPYPGKLYWPDKPSEGGKEVYGDCPKDLTGDYVSPSNFTRLLRGEAVGSKRLMSGPDDRIFMYFCDHGMYQLLLFPNSLILHAADFIDALKYMHENDMYKEMVIYIEACHSGSLFNKLMPDDWNIYAMSATDPLHSGYLCRCYHLGPEKKKFCYAACYGEYYLEDTEEALKNGTFDKRTLNQQYISMKDRAEFIKDQTPCQYGDLGIGNSTLNWFQGPGKNKDLMHVIDVISERKYNDNKMKMDELEYSKLYDLKYNYERSNSYKDKRTYDEYLDYIKKIDLIWKSFGKHFSIRMSEYNSHYDCYPDDVADPKCTRLLITEVEKVCGNFDEYSISYVSYLYEACRKEIIVDNVIDYLVKVC